MHERIHEFPITGGASTLAKSVFENDLKEIGDKLLSSLNWHGVAMVEFKRDAASGQLKLIEINPKFWGSFELSYKAGINFAYLAYLVALRKNHSRDPPIKLMFISDGLYLMILYGINMLRLEQRTEFKKLKKNSKDSF